MLTKICFVFIVLVLILVVSDAYWGDSPDGWVLTALQLIWGIVKHWVVSLTYSLIAGSIFIGLSSISDMDSLDSTIISLAFGVPITFLVRYFFFMSMSSDVKKEKKKTSHWLERWYM